MCVQCAYGVCVCSITACELGFRGSRGGQVYIQFSQLLAVGSLCRPCCPLRGPCPQYIQTTLCPVKEVQHYVSQAVPEGASPQLAPVKRRRWCPHQAGPQAQQAGVWRDKPLFAERLLATGDATNAEALRSAEESRSNRKTNPAPLPCPQCAAATVV